jgi:integrase
LKRIFDAIRQEPPLPKIDLTDRTLRALQPLDGKKQTEYFDNKCRGLGIRISAKTKAWFFASRVGNRSVRIPIGTFDGTGLADAREAAEILRSQIRQGLDPVATRRAKLDAIAEAHENTIAELGERYMRDRVAPRCRPRTIKNYQWFFRTKELAKFNGRSAASVTRRELIALRDAMGHRPRTALFMRQLSAFFSWAFNNEIIPTNPAARIEQVKTPSRSRVLSLDEIARIWRATGAAGAVGSTYIRVLILLALRRGETALMEWSWIDFDGATLRIPARATKSNLQFDVPLVPQVINLLQALPRLSDRYCFSHDGARPIGAHEKRKEKIERAMEVPVSDWRLHDFRRAFSSYANEHDLANSDTIEACLNHVSHRNAVQRVYDHSTRMPQRRRLMALWADAVINAVEGRGVVGNVVPLVVA